MVAKILSQKVVKILVVDLVRFFGPKFFRNDDILLLGDEHFEAAENWSEKGEVYESGFGLGIVLEVWLN